MSDVAIDALLPAEIAEKVEAVGVRKAEAPAFQLFALAVLAGAFIALGAIFSTTVAAGSASLPYGLARLLIGMVFSLGLILVIIGGAELFTGNNLIVMAWASRKITTQALLRNWGIVYTGNFVGAVATAALMVVTKQYMFGKAAVGVAALSTAVSKCSLDFGQALALGVLCNALVCLAVWLTFSAHSSLDKIACVLFPVTAFVAAGFEHSIANMYYVPYALFLKAFDPSFIAQVEPSVPNLERLTWSNFLIGNLLPVTIGNIIGGAVLVAAVYWSVYLRHKRL
ncbi:formate/nitrite family transporter [Armatimonas sp.]|uniref:formate/nitrite transporter family protein n=1 Tax=Armatimonas sp. TaxID=1872638 RepID=UPI00286A9ECA|nr:formate/nitrite family transporter [Armatimonas sp.]